MRQLESRQQVERPTHRTHRKVSATSPCRVGERRFFDSGRPLPSVLTRQLRHFLAALATAWFVAMAAPEAAAMAETIRHDGATEPDLASQGDSVPDRRDGHGQALRLPSRFRGVAGRVHRPSCERHVAIVANGHASRDPLLRQRFMPASSPSRIDDPKILTLRPPRGPPSV